MRIHGLRFSITPRPRPLCARLRGTRTARDFEELARTRLTIPVLSIGGENANGAALAEQTKAVAADATTVVLEGSGHWVMEERPKETADALLNFL
jgi:pimeloyl-ACP methyl ester carboxylesterase